MPRSSGLFLLTLYLAMFSMPTQAQWAWRDKTQDKQVTYSDRPPPPSIPDQDILKRPNQPAVYAPPPPLSASEVALTRPRLVDPTLQAKRKEAQRQEQAKKQKEADRVAAARAENCQRTLKHLQALESGTRLATTNAQGELDVMDDAARNKELQATRRIAASNCK